jgi:2-polyprenyl-3-methyl-5-hydroxy-6-metoxy-1,4-benzoquinol methylase
MPGGGLKGDGMYTGDTPSPEVPAGPKGKTLANTLTGLLQPDPACTELNSVPLPAEELAGLDARSNFPSRWVSEAQFFDEIAQQLIARLQPMDPFTVARYREARHPWFNKEFRFQLLGDLRGKRVLDLGCGDGINATLMARFGAQVTGVDISPGCVELCKQRARLEGVEARTQFLCSPLEAVELPEGQFDIIWGDGILHHVIPELDAVMRQLMTWAKPGALFIFSEPVSLTPWLRKLRKGVPIHTNATPDERPLGKAELSTIVRYLPGLELKWFHLLGRLTSLLLPLHHTYETASLPKRLAVDLLGRADQVLLSMPQLKTLGGMCVMYGRKPETR